MIIFEELVYQEAMRRKIASYRPRKLKRAETEFRKQFSSPDQYQQYVQARDDGSEQQYGRRCERSLLIEQVLKIGRRGQSPQCRRRSARLLRKNPARFQQPETFTFQSISVCRRSK